MQTNQSVPPMSLPQVQMPHMNVLPLPIKIKISQFPYELTANPDKIALDGKVTRTSVDSNVITVAAFLKAYLMTKKPNHLLNLIHFHWKKDTAGGTDRSSKKGGGRGSGNAAWTGIVDIKFGDVINDFTVIVRDEEEDSNSNSGSSKKTDLVLGLFLQEGETGYPSSLDPTGKMISTCIM